MALDEKFIQSPVSDKLAKKLNKRVKKKKRPKPWDEPEQQVTNKQSSLEVNGSSNIDKVIEPPESSSSNKNRNPTLTKDKTTAGEISFKKSTIGAQLEHRNKEPKSNKNETFNKNKSTIGAQDDCVDNKLLRAQLEHKNTEVASVTGSTIGAQLEHENELENSKGSFLTENKSTIRAQEANKETLSIRAQLEHENSEIKELSDTLIRAQLEHEYNSKPLSKNKHVKEKQSTIRAHKEHKELVRAQLEHESVNQNSYLEHNKGAKKGTSLDLIGAQLEHRTLRADYEVLGGLELRLLMFIHSNCVLQGGLESSKLSRSYITQALEIKGNTLKTVIKRVVDKGFLARSGSKRGRSGWLKFTISEELYTKILYSNHNQAKENLNNKSTIGAHKEHNRGSERGLEKGSAPHSSSNNFNLKNTTTINENDLDSLLNQIEIPEEVLNVGFNESHLRQIIPQYKLDMNSLQESLNHYALDLQNGSVRAGFGKLNMIVGILKKSNQYVSEAYISEEQNMLKELAERKRLLDELEKQKAEIALLKKFNSWKEGLTQDQINNYVPPSNLISEGSKLQDIQLQGYFETNFNENEGK